MLIVYCWLFICKTIIVQSDQIALYLFSKNHFNAGLGVDAFNH